MFNIKEPLFFCCPNCKKEILKFENDDVINLSDKPVFSNVETIELEHYEQDFVLFPTLLKGTCDACQQNYIQQKINITHSNASQFKRIFNSILTEDSHIKNYIFDEGEAIDQDIKTVVSVEETHFGRLFSLNFDLISESHYLEKKDLYNQRLFDYFQIAKYLILNFDKALKRANLRMHSSLPTDVQHVLFNDIDENLVIEFDHSGDCIEIDKHSPVYDDIVDFVLKNVDEIGKDSSSVDFVFLTLKCPFSLFFDEFKNKLYFKDPDYFNQFFNKSYNCEKLYLYFPKEIKD